jgi:hypothetical protein
MNLTISKNDFINEFKRYQSRTKDSFIKCCELIYMAKEEAYFNEALTELGIEKTSAYKMCKVYEKFNSGDVATIPMNISQSHLIELTSPVFDDYTGEYLINQVVKHNMTVKGIRQWRKELSGSTPTTEEVPILDRVVKLMEKLSLEEKQKLIELLQDDRTLSEKLLDAIFNGGIE